MHLPGKVVSRRNVFLGGVPKTKARRQALCARAIPTARWLTAPPTLKGPLRLLCIRNHGRGPGGEPLNQTRNCLGFVVEQFPGSVPLFDQVCEGRKVSITGRMP